MSTKGTMIDRIRAGEPYQGVYHVKSCVSSTSSSGSRYTRFVLQDCTGSICAYYWNDLNTDIEAGSEVWVSGRGRTFGGRLISDITAIIEPLSWDGCPLLLASPNVPLPAESTKVALLLEQIQASSLKELSFRLMTERSFMRALLQAPASLRHHHAYPGGLIKHTRETMEIVLEQTKDLSPLERDLLLTAAFLHDLGKAYEYASYKTLTERGELLGHEVTLLEILSPLMNGIWTFNDPVRVALLHFLVAKPAPQWTGIRHPRSALINILRFADRLSAERDLENSRRSNRIGALSMMARADDNQGALDSANAACK